jgi:hypothetical protein
MSNGVTAWSYSRYADYQQCPARFKYKHLDKLPDPGGAAMQRGSDIHKQGENWLKAGGKGAPPKDYKHFASEMKQLAKLNPLVEQQWGFTQDWSPTGWFGAQTWLRIVADVAVVYDDCTADIVDFKTGRKYGTNEDQIELFSMGGFMKWPDVEHVTARLWYLDIPDGPNTDGDPHEESTANTTIREYTRDEFEAARKAWGKRVEPMFKDKRFAPRANSKCVWCPYSKAKGGPCKY